MSELRELYQSVILDHSRKPRNSGTLENANRVATGHNPLCGDKIRLYLDVEDDVVKDIRFEGSGCAISTASASLMTQAVKNQPLQEVMRLFDGFHELVTKSSSEEIDADGLGKLAVFAGVRAFPMRVKCATLAWHTMQATLKSERETVSTE